MGNSGIIFNTTAMAEAIAAAVVAGLHSKKRKNQENKNHIRFS